MNRRRPGSYALSLLVVVVGLATLAAGVACIYWPAGLIVGGVLVAAYGLFMVDVPERRGVR